MIFMENLTDEQLISLYLQGDEPALDILVKRYLPLIYSFARRYSGDPDKASDIAQETFVKAWRNIDKFDIKRSFRHWIFTIAKHTALDWLKKKEAAPFSYLERDADDDREISIASNIMDTAELAPVLLDRKLSSDIVNRAMGKLPNHYYRVVLMHHRDDLTFKEMSRKLKKPVNTVKSQYRRAIQLLKKNLS